MIQEEAEVMKLQNVDSDFPTQIPINTSFIENINAIQAPEVVEHLNSLPDASSSKKLDEHIQAKREKAREKKKRWKANQRRKIELSNNLSFLSNGVSPSTSGIQENSANNHILEYSDQAPASADTEELKEEVSAVISTNILESHAHIDSNSEAKEFRSPKRKKGVRKKKKVSSDSISLNNGALVDTKGTLAKVSPLEILNKIPTSAYTEELMGEAVPVNEPTFIIKENDPRSVNESEEYGVLYDASVKDVSEKLSGELNKYNLDTECSTSKVEHISEDATTILSELSEGTDGDDISFKDLSEEGSKEFNKDRIDTENGILNIEHTLQNATITSSELSENSDGDGVSQTDNGKEGPSTPVEVHSGKLKKKLLVLDVNGILADIVARVSEEYTPDTFISRKAVFKRPFCDDFLRFCFENFLVGVWSSRTMRNVKSAVDFLMGDLQKKLLFCWDQTQCTDTGFNTLENRDKPMLLKELKRLWEKNEPNLPWERGDYNESNTLLLDDSPYKALQNPPYTAIFPNPYCYKDVKDNSLGSGGDLRVYLEGLASADDVQKYVEANPFGQQAITNANASWKFYRKVIHDTSLSTRKS